jgi:hypothetical protein
VTRVAPERVTALQQDDPSRTHPHAASYLAGMGSVTADDQEARSRVPGDRHARFCGNSEMVSLRAIRPWRLSPCVLRASGCCRPGQLGVGGRGFVGRSADRLRSTAVGESRAKRVDSLPPARGAPIESNLRSRSPGLAPACAGAPNTRQLCEQTGLTPACAGSALMTRDELDVTMTQPRLPGERDPAQTIPGQPSDSPPLARGAPLGHLDDVVGDRRAPAVARNPMVGLGLTPACAGSDTCVRLLQTWPC